MEQQAGNNPELTQPSKPWGKILLIAALVSAPLVLVVVYSMVAKDSGLSQATGPIKSVDWPTLRELNLETGQAPESLKSLDGARVRIPGFMVPLEDNRQEVSEFLLVPNPQACIHAPAPPANQMVLVRMTKDPVKMAWGPVWVEGNLRLSTGTTQYGSASFQLLGHRTEPYKAEF